MNEYKLISRYIIIAHLITNVNCI